MAMADGHTPSADITGVYIWSGTTQPAVNPPGPTPATTEPSVYDQGKSAYDHKDYAKARTLFTQACDGSNMNACNYLGAIYDQGQGVPVDDAAASKIYQKSCDQGNMRGCNNLGTVLQNLGKSDEARKYLQKACDGKVAEACDMLRGVQ